MIRIVVILLVASAAGAAEAANFGGEHWEIDRSSLWYRSDVSHHDKHAEGGAEIGFVAYEGAALATDSEAKRFAVAIGTGAAIGIGYEIIEGRNLKSYVDPVDALWCTAGAAIGAGLASAANHLVDAIVFAPTTDHRGASCAVAWRF